MADTPRVTVPVEPEGVSPVYSAAYDSIRKGAPGLSDATCAVIARSINMKVSCLSAAPAPEGGAIKKALVEAYYSGWEDGNCREEYSADKARSESDRILALATREEAPAEDAFLSWLEREIDEASLDIGAAHQEGGTATEREKARSGTLSDVRAEYLSLRAQPQARDDARDAIAKTLEDFLVDGIEAWKINDAAAIDAAIEKAGSAILSLRNGEGQ